METTYYSLATKNNFNISLRHFFKVNEVVDDIERKRNIADILNADLDANEIVKDQILPIIGAVIRDKFEYSYDSFSISETISEFAKIIEETKKWTALDIVIVYFNPNGEVFLINPKNSEHWEKVRELNRDQLAVIYVRHLKPERNRKIERDAIKAIEEMLMGKDVFINPDFVDHTVQARPETSAPISPRPVAIGARGGVVAKPTGKKRITPKYAVTVTNELFHNGNVEAWKKIIESYQTKYPDLKVNIFFEGELINDINSLFKWGKVKNGDSIFFQVIGEDIQGVSKLQKYLSEGASPRFEQFLKIGVGRVLNLF